MGIGFGEALLLIGALLATAAALSGLMRGTVLSISVLAMGAGIALALVDVIEVNPGDSAVIYLIELALILTLFADGLLVERELLRIHWSPAARAIALAMPVTLGLLALGARVLFPELTWAEAFLLAAVVILASILAHGLTDTGGARWIDRRMKGEARAAEDVPGALLD